MAYTAAQYERQNRIMEIIRWATHHNKCPVCRRDKPSEIPGICCSKECAAQWLNFRPEKHEHDNNT